MSEGRLTEEQIARPTAHYGAGKPATRHFMLQRVTGVCNVLFTFFLVWLVVSLAGADRSGMVTTIAHPAVAPVLALLIVNVAIHMSNGMREVIEDYLDGPGKALALAANFGFAALVAALVLGSIAKLVFWG